MEEWKVVEGFEWYEVSNKGTVRSIDRMVPYLRKGETLYRFCKGKQLSPGESAMGYFTVALCNPEIKSGKSFTVHSLVARHFLDYREGLVVNHIDGNKQNNVVENLEYVTSQENNLHAHRIGLKSGRNKMRCAAGDKVYDSITSLAKSELLNRGCAYYRVMNNLTIDGVSYRLL